MLAGASETLGYAAEALLLAGDLDGARRELDEALQISERLGERIYLPQLLLIEAALARGHGDSVAANASVRCAIDEARAQEAAWLELLAMLELFEYGDATAQDRRALETLIEMLPEAIDTAAHAKARAWLGDTPPT